MKKHELLALLYDDLKDEIAAIEQYQNHINKLTDKKLIAALEEIRDDEKAHVFKLHKLIFNLGGSLDKE